MAIEQPGFSIGFMKAAASLATKQFYCVKVTADETINICTVEGLVFLGILQDKPVAGSPGNVMVDGVSKVIAGDTLVAGTKWMNAADGTAIPWTTGHVAAGQVLIGASVTLGGQNAAAGYSETNAVVAAAAGKQINGGVDTVSATEASATTMNIAHGLGTCVAVSIMILDTGNQLVTTDADVTISGANIVVAAGDGFVLTENYKVHWIAFGTVA
jgi:hypothetical protein